MKFSSLGIILILFGVCCGTVAFSQEPCAIFKAQGGSVYGVTFTQDGKTLAAPCNDGSVELWEISTSKRQTILRGHTWPLGTVAFSPDGKLLASGSMEGTLKVWDTVTGKEKATLIKRVDEVNSFNLRTVTALAFSPDGSVLASSSDDWTVRLWDVATFKQIASVRKHGAGLAFSADGCSLASGDFDFTVRVWDVAKLQTRATYKGPTRGVSALAFVGDRLLAVAAPAVRTDKLVLWEPATPERTINLEGDAEVLGMAFSRDGKLLAGAGNVLRPTVRLWDVATGRLKANLPGPDKGGTGVSFSSDGKWLASGGEDGTVRLWSVPAILTEKKRP